MIKKPFYSFYKNAILQLDFIYIKFDLNLNNLKNYLELNLFKENLDIEKNLVIKDQDILNIYINSLIFEFFFMYTNRVVSLNPKNKKILLNKLVIVDNFLIFFNLNYFPYSVLITNENIRFFMKNIFLSNLDFIIFKKQKIKLVLF